MSENMINSVLCVMGYDMKIEVCGYGFRMMVCGVMGELGLWSDDVIE